MTKTAEKIHGRVLIKLNTVMRAHEGMLANTQPEDLLAVPHDTGLTYMPSVCTLHEGVMP